MPESAFFAAPLSQHLELFLTLVHLTEHHHQYFTTVSTCQIISAWENGFTAIAAPADIMPFVNLQVSSPALLLVNPAFLMVHLLGLCLPAVHWHHHGT